MNTEEKNKLAEENLGLVYLVVNKEFTYEKTTESDRENYIEEGLTFKDLMIYEKDDYTSKVDLEHLLKVLKKIEIEIYDIRKIIIKKSEGYKNIEIAKMIGVEKNTIKHRIDKAKIKLIELGITA